MKISNSGQLNETPSLSYFLTPMLGCWIGETGQNNSSTGLNVLILNFENNINTSLFLGLAPRTSLAGLPSIYTLADYYNFIVIT